MQNLIELLAHWAKMEPQRLLYGFLGRDGEIAASYSYGDFDAETRCLARVLTEEFDVLAGEPVILAHVPGLDLISAFIACVKAGAIPIPMPFPSAIGATSLDRIRHVVEESGADKILSNRAVPGLRSERLPSFSPRSGGDAWSQVWVTSCGTARRQHEAKPDDLLFLQYTSGSTRLPRGVMVSHRNVIANCRAVIDRRHVGVSWLPHFHDFGLIGYLLFPLVHGGTAYHFSPQDFIRRPLLWLDAVSRYQATITCAPNFAFEYCLRKDKISDADLGKLDLSSMTLMMNGSERVRPETMRGFADRFSSAGLPRGSLIASYGLAENTLGVSAGGRGSICVDKALIGARKVRPLKDAQSASGVSFASCGVPLKGVRVELVSPETGRRVPGDEVGEIWVAGTSKTQGYWRNPDLTSETFEVEISDGDSTRFLRTGDMGFVVDGELYVCGRLKDLIVIRGVNLYPTDVEAAVEAVLRVPQGAVAAFGFGRSDESDDGMVILIEGRSNDRPDLAALYRNIRNSIQGPVLQIAVVPKGSIVRTSSGKIARQQCRSNWRAGMISVLDTLSPDEGGVKLSGLAEVSARLVERSGGDVSMTIAELGLDSLELVSLSLEIERLLRDLGEDADVSEEVFDLEMLQTLSLKQLMMWSGVLDAEGADAGAVRAFCAEAARLRLEHDSKAMRSDAELPSDLTCEPLDAPLHRLEGGDILLTGATGFLGSFLLDALLRLTDRKVWVLARDIGAVGAEQRVRRALVRAGGTREAGRRVEVLVGNLARRQIGLSDKLWKMMSDRVGDVIHCGAEVDYVRGYAALRAANVSSVKELLKLGSTGRRKIIHHISTTFIFGWSSDRAARERDCNAAMRGLDFGYSQSKWVAEQLALKAAEAGMDVRIYRPAFVTASSGGCLSPDDILVRTLAYMIRHGVSVNIENQLSIIPVDICAQNIVALSLLPGESARTFHLTGDNYHTMRHACEAIEAMYGYSFEYVDVKTFVNHMKQHCRPDDPLFALLAFFRKNSARLQAMDKKRYDNSNFTGAKARSRQILDDASLSDTMKWIVDSLLRQRLIPAPPVARRQPQIMVSQ